MTYEIKVRDKGFNVVGVLWPVESGIQPESIRWDRRWREPSTFELIAPIQIPYLDELTTLGNYIEVRNADDDTFEALYLIEATDLQTGIVRHQQSIAGRINAVYAAGQGVGELRNVVVRVDADSVTSISRMEGFLDARDVEEDNFDLLRQRADAKLAEMKPPGGFSATGGAPKPREMLKVTGRSLLLFAERRVIVPPPATVAVDIVDITGDAYDEDTEQADEVMKHYTDTHLINPADGARKVANFVNQGAIPALASLTYQGRFGSVLEALQEIGELANAGFEVVLNGSDEFEFQVLPQVVHTIDSSQPVVFRNTDVLLDIDGRAYRANWDIGDLVTLEVASLDLQLDVTIMQVRRVLVPGQPEQVTVSLDTPTADDLERFRDAIVERGKANTLAARA